MACGAVCSTRWTLAAELKNVNIATCMHEHGRARAADTQDGTLRDGACEPAVSSRWRRTRGHVAVNFQPKRNNAEEGPERLELLFEQDPPNKPGTRSSSSPSRKRRTITSCWAGNEKSVASPGCSTGSQSPQPQLSRVSTTTTRAACVGRGPLPLPLPSVGAIKTFGTHVSCWAGQR